jgi:hypothetical protein
MKVGRISNEHHDASTNSSIDKEMHDKMKEENQRRRAIHKNLVGGGADGELMTD